MATQVLFGYKLFCFGNEFGNKNVQLESNVQTEQEKHRVLPELMGSRRLKEERLSAIV